MVVVCGGEDEPPPPQPVTDTPAKAMAAIAISNARLRFQGSKRAQQDRRPRYGRATKGRLGPRRSNCRCGDRSRYGAAVSPNCTVELDRLHVGAGVADGVMLQLRLTVPVNVPAGATAMPNCAFCPAAIDCDVCEPAANRIVKSGAATPLPESARFCACFRRSGSRRSSRSHFPQR